MLEFAASSRASIGVEWELQLVSPTTGELLPVAPAVLQELEWRGGSRGLVHPEMHQCMLELVSRPRRRVAECLADLAEGFELLAPLLEAQGAAATSAGVHPFADPLEQAVTECERYGELVERTQDWGRQMLIFGTHVHVGIDDATRVIPVLNHLCSYIGHLQALAAASPSWAGRDTGYADNRAMMFQQLPTAGLPEPVDSWGELEQMLADLVRAGALREFNELRWDVRPSPRLGTIEIRACDASSNLLEVGAVAALTHCLVEEALRLLDAGESLRRFPHWLLAANKWRSARYGLEALLVERRDADPVPVRESLTQLVRRLEPVAADLGCVEELAGVLQVLELGSGAHRQRSVATQGGTARVVQLLLAETRAGHPLPVT
ncbi:Carboxylate-amine ligase YbdK [Actinomyces bovis]|uniref:Putative glutamate--cysteine ligase 2 n=1 Tax=Actinomyces bovis TaxID=1658 RepID=A0ABY1VK61_9ACTO|nr:glutamate--cysteine ligase [Actinomyces bovis]SPT52488.1 Carboxylate-amine ligase YbdK [Actinomyces bovis]VEG54189.1 Carboxylate-amine ligase YbdK [Actinomyces israelii]